MSKWQAEVRLIGRFLGSGVVNTLLGFLAIFTLIAVGVAPLWANVAGYGIGITFGFVSSRNFVFRGEGRIRAQGVRYLLAFFGCFFLNLFVLNFGLRFMDAVPAQLLASMAYTLGMFSLSRLWVYRN